MDEFRNHPLYQEHDIDSIMGSLWAFYTKKFLVLFTLSFIISLITQYLSSTFNFRELQTLTDPVEMMEKIREFIWPMILISLLSLFGTAILHYYIIFNPVDSSKTIFESIFRSLRYFIPYLIIIILLAFFGSIAMTLGLFVLIIGIFFVLLYLVTLYLFILPILMVEGPDIANAISRAFKLTHRRFWTNIGWVAVMIVIIMVIAIIMSGLILLPFTGNFFKVLSDPAEASGAIDFMSNPFYMILSALVNALYFPILPVFATALYFNGRAREEETGDIASSKKENNISVEDLYSRTPENDDTNNPVNQ
ncbi:MAG: glycerophosphoryl diester phosphodiesterase membrane domain-containing protein [Bacteroidales bacterium]|nr:glycerophosphoryl diester phosphodiesterase membrane domain-containing protein [Bacteroidales bacterium]